MRVRFIKAVDTHPLRLLVLRPGGHPDDVDFANDRLPGAFHLGVGIGAHLITVGSFYPEKKAELTGWKQYRLRGMATHPDFRGQGAGRKLVLFALEHLRAQQADLLWCNARLVAVPFYQHLGMRTVGDEFDIPGIGPHYLMVRPL
jgi:GNAT superfamily N-acetyltransferase